MATTRLGRGGYPAAALSSGPITGSLAVTEADDALAATGASTVTGALTKTEADDTLSAAGGEVITGALAVTEANDSLSAAGSSSITGSLTVTEANDALAATANNTTPVTTTNNIDVTLTKEQLEAYLRERRRNEKKRFEDFAKEGRKGDDIRQSLESFFAVAEPAEAEAIKAELPVLAEKPKEASRSKAFVDRVDWKTLETSKETLSRINAAVAEYAKYHEKLRVEAERRAREEEDEADVEFLLLSM